MPDTDGVRYADVDVPLIDNAAPVIMPLVSILPVDDIEHCEVQTPMLV